MFPKIKSLIYPLLISNPSFTLFSNDKRLEKSFIISRNYNNCKVSGKYDYLSSYSDKTSINNPCNKDIIECILKIYYGEDTYYETISHNLIYLKNDDKPYHSKLEYNLYKNDLPIKISEIEKDLLQKLDIYHLF